MTLPRRDFLAGTAALAATAALTGRADALPPALVSASAPGDPAIRDLALRALDAARSAGASYADVRVGQNRTQAMFTCERRVQGLADTETAGVGVRTLVDRCLGLRRHARPHGRRRRGGRAAGRGAGAGQPRGAGAAGDARPGHPNA